jgi:DNA-binding HxlR family transcriptional regulator
LKLIERKSPLGSRNNAFKLTEAGLALKPIIEALGKWSSKYLYEFHSEIVKL